MKALVSDRMKCQNIGGLKIPEFKGKVKITLHDDKTGKDRIIAGENIITNAVKDILANNYIGAIDTKALLPLCEKFFGGILVFEQAHTLNADNYFVPADSDNHLWAHAGDQAPASAVVAQEDLQRGSPVRTTRTENSITHTWEWGHSQGNSGDRYIRALALCHKDVGNAGLGNTSTAFKNLDPFLNVASNSLSQVTTNLTANDNLFAQYDDNHGLYFTIGEPGDFAAENTRFATTYLTVYVKRLPYYKTGLFETDIVRTDNPRVFTVQLSWTMYLQPCYHFDYANKKLYVFSNATSINSSSPNKCKYAIIDCVNEAVLSEGELTSDTNNLAPIPMQPNGTGFVYGDQPRNYNIIFDGTNVWLPTTSGASWTESTGYTNTNGFKKIKLSDSTNYTDVEYNETQERQGAMMKSGGLIVTSGRVINGTTGFTCADNYPVINGGLDDGYTTYSFHEPYKPISFATRVGATQQGTALQPRFLLVNKFLLTTLYNIPNADIFHKTATESMSIEYTIEET